VTLSLYPVNDVGRYGSVGVNDSGRVTGFQEKAQGLGAGVINAGVSVLSKKFIESLPAKPFSMEQEVFPRLVEAGGMFGLRQQRPFFDIGTPESYRDFVRFVKEHPEYAACAP